MSLDDPGRQKDALGLYLTGATSDGGTQPNPAAALGNFRSSTEALLLGGFIDDPIPPVIIKKFNGSNGEGAATIRSDADGNYYYTAPGDAEGDGVEVADGETKVLKSFDEDEFVRIQRDGSEQIADYMTISLMEAYNNVFGMSNIANAARVTGTSRYRAIMLRATGPYDVLAIKIYIKELGTSVTTNGEVLAASGAGFITLGSGNFEDWPDTGFAQIRDSGGTLKEIVYYNEKQRNILTIGSSGYRGLLGTSATAGATTDAAHAVPGIRIAEEAVDGSNKIQTIANETTAPTGLSWNTSITISGGVSIAQIAAGQNHGLWLHEQIPPNAVQSYQMKNGVYIQYWAA